MFSFGLFTIIQEVNASIIYLKMLLVHQADVHMNFIYIETAIRYYYCIVFVLLLYVFIIIQFNAIDLIVIIILNKITRR